MGALAYTDRVHTALYPGAHGTTFGGNPLACAGLAALEVYQREELIDRAAEMGQMLFDRLNAALANRTVVRDTWAGSHGRHRTAEAWGPICGR